MTAWSDRLRQAMTWKGWSASELARRTDIPPSRLYKYIHGKVAQPRGDVLKVLAQTMGVNEQWLRNGNGPHYTRFPVVGYVGAGESFIPYDDLTKGTGLDELDFDVDAGDPIAVQVRGRSMEPVYRPGDFLVCSREQGRDVNSFVGRDCVVLVETGEGYVKRVVHGSETGRYTLLSYAASPIENVTLRWAAPIIWVRRSQ